MAHSIERSIPKIQLDILSCTLLTAMDRFYADPETLKGYNDWLQGEGQAYAQKEAV